VDNEDFGGCLMIAIVVFFIICVGVVAHIAGIESAVKHFETLRCQELGHDDAIVDWYGRSLKYEYKVACYSLIK
jgi:hypothetical protein